MGSEMTKLRMMATKANGQRRFTYCETLLEDFQRTWKKCFGEKPLRLLSPSGWMPWVMMEGRREDDSPVWW